MLAAGELLLSHRQVAGRELELAESSGSEEDEGAPGGAQAARRVRVEGRAEPQDCGAQVSRCAVLDVGVRGEFLVGMAFVLGSREIRGSLSWAVTDYAEEFSSGGSLFLLS